MAAVVAVAVAVVVAAAAAAAAVGPAEQLPRARRRVGERRRSARLVQLGI